MSKLGPYSVDLPESWKESVWLLVTLKMHGIQGEQYTGHRELAKMACLADSVGDLVACLRACLVEIDQEIEQRKLGGNDEDWAALAELSDRSHAAVRAVEDAA